MPHPTLSVAHRKVFCTGGTSIIPEQSHKTHGPCEHVDLDEQILNMSHECSEVPTFIVLGRILGSLDRTLQKFHQLHHISIVLHHVSI